MNEEEGTRLRKLVNKIEKSQAGLDATMPSFVLLYNAYKAFLDQDVVEYLDSVGQKRLPIYYIMDKLQKINAKFIEAYFTNKQFAKINEKPSLVSSNISIPLAGQLFQVEDQNIEITRESIKKLQNAVDHYTTEDDDSVLYHSLSAALYDMLGYGNGIIKCDWSDQLIIERIHLKNLKFDVEAEDINNLKYCVHDIYMTKDEIMRLKDGGVFKDANYEQVKAEETNENQVESARRIKLQEVYELIDDTWKVTTIFDKKIILREDVELPMGLPFILGKIKLQRNNPDGSEDSNSVLIYGDSIAAPLIPIQQAVTILRNQMLDDATAEQRWIIKDQSINPFDFANKNLPAIRTTGSIADFKEIPTGYAKDKQYNTDKLELDGQESVGIVDYGSNDGKGMNNTATGMSILTSESNTMLQHLLRGCNETLIKPLFRRITKLVWAYGDAKFFYGVDRTAELEYNVGVDVGLGATNKEQQIQSKNIAYSKMIEIAQMQPDPMKQQLEIENAKKFMYREIFPLMGIENFEEYYKDEQATENGNPFENPSMAGFNGGIEDPRAGFNQ